jgi:hypothetical protein
MIKKDTICEIPACIISDFKELVFLTLDELIIPDNAEEVYKRFGGKLD